MKLAELKAQNEAEEREKAGAVNIEPVDETNVDQDEVDTDEADADENVDDTGAQEPQDTQDDTQEPKEPQENQDDLEPWQRTDEKKVVPVAVLRDTRDKLKGRISERDDEIERLKSEIESIKKQTVSTTTTQAGGQTTRLKRPDELDYDTDDAYQNALYEYENKIVEQKFNEIEQKRQQETQQRQFNDRLTKSVDEHYERAAKLINDSGIDADIYKASDLTVRQAINSIRPNQGDLITDQLIDILGDGSEKVLYYLGRNKPALNEFIVKLHEDPSGTKAAVFVGEQKARLASPNKKTSNARPPAKTVKGDTSATNNSAKRLMKKYKDAHKAGDSQAAYNVRKEAKANKIDVSSW